MTSTVQQIKKNIVDIKALSKGQFVRQYTSPSVLCAFLCALYTIHCTEAIDDETEMKRNRIISEFNEIHRRLDEQKEILLAELDGIAAAKRTSLLDLAHLLEDNNGNDQPADRAEVPLEGRDHHITRESTNYIDKYQFQRPPREPINFDMDSDSTFNAEAASAIARPSRPRCQSRYDVDSVHSAL